MSDLDAAREWVGSQPGDTDLQAVINRYDGDPSRAALSVLRTRRADMVAEFDTVSVTGDVSTTRRLEHRLAALDRQITALEALCGLPSTLGVTGLRSAPLVTRSGRR